MKHQIVVSNVLIKDNKVLLALRSDWQRWETPGGKVDEDETIIDACKREMFEETGIILKGTAQFISYVDIARERTPGRRLIMFHRWFDWEGEPKLMEPKKCLDIRWFDLQSLPERSSCTPGSAICLYDLLPQILAEKGSC